MANDMTKKKPISTMIKYVKHHVGDLSIDERHDILQILINSPVIDKKIQTKGDGTQIKFNDIPNTTIITIHNYIHTKLNSKKDELQYFLNEDDET
jgi:hypothetical protein